MEEIIEISKYQKWYDDIIRAARGRKTPKAYTEVHHIKPKSLGGSDDAANLVRLTYREHFLVHWLLVKFCTGADLRKMQRALFAMTMPLHGQRIIAGWQYALAKSTIRDLELDPQAEKEWYERWRKAKDVYLSHRKQARKIRRDQVKVRYVKKLAESFGQKIVVAVGQEEIDRISASFLSNSKSILFDKKADDAPLSKAQLKHRASARRRRPRPGKRFRERNREAIAG